MAIHTSHPDMGYRRISDELNRRYDVHVNEKRILRIDRVLHIQSDIVNISLHFFLKDI